MTLPRRRRRADWMWQDGTPPRFRSWTCHVRWTGRFAWRAVAERYPAGIVRRWWIGPWMVLYRRALDED